MIGIFEKNFIFSNNDQLILLLFIPQILIETI